MNVDAERLKRAIEDHLVGVTDDEIDELLRIASMPEGLAETRRRPKRKSAPFFDQMADIGQARTWVSKADALHDPDVAMLRALSERDRARVLLFTDQIDQWSPWVGPLSEEFLVLPPRGLEAPRAVSIASLKASTNPFARLAPWFARTALRISKEYRVQPEFAFSFLLLDGFWRPMPWVGVQVERFGTGAHHARIYLDIDSVATEAEVLLAFRTARAELRSEEPKARKRECRAKTVALAFLFAAQISEGEVITTAVDWEALMMIWNTLCEIEQRSSWAYPSNSVHQFSRDVKHALVAVRGDETRFPIVPERKRKPVNPFS